MSNINKERVANLLQFNSEGSDCQANAEQWEVHELARIALASLEAEPAIHRWRRVTVEPYGPYPWHYGNFIGFSKPVEGIEDEYFYSAPPAPVAVPAAYEHTEDFSEYHEGWNACRSAMLQGAVQPQNQQQNIPENIPATQFKPVADLYGLTSPDGGETSFTFDAVEARDFIDGGWSVQEYVELKRYQEVILQGAEPVKTACKLRDAAEIIRNSGIAIDAEKIFAERDVLNTPDCWCRTCRPVTVTDMRFVVCPDCGNKRCPHANDHRNACTGSNEPGQEGSAYPAAQQQEVKP